MQAVHVNNAVQRRHSVLQCSLFRGRCKHLRNLHRSCAADRSYHCAVFCDGSGCPAGAGGDLYHPFCVRAERIDGSDERRHFCGNGGVHRGAGCVCERRSGQCQGGGEGGVSGAGSKGQGGATETIRLAVVRLIGREH